MATGFMAGSRVPIVSGFSFITDTALRPPPTTGLYAYSPPYGTFYQGQPGFPGLGGTYPDPVFGTIIRRLTDGGTSLTSPNVQDLYGKNHWFNADETRIVNTMADNTVRAIDTTTGATKLLTNAGNPWRQNASCSPSDPDAFFYIVGTQIKRQSINSGTITTYKDFSATLGDLGGSFNWISGDGRYFLVNLGGTGTTAYRVWDSLTDTLLTGTVSDTAGQGGGWMAMAHDASCIMLNGNPTKKTFAIDKTAGTLSTTGVTLTAANGTDHSCMITCTDGVTYLAWVDNSANPARLLRINCATGASATAFTFPSDSYYWAQPDHWSPISKGPLQNWVAFSSDATSHNIYGSLDWFNATDPVANWHKMQQEIYMINLLTGAIRRLAHHRSRQPSASWKYGLLPRVCASPSGSKLAFASNYGFESSPEGYADLFMVQVPAG